jgi:hypothetical protein
MIIAWRILYLTMIARQYPDASCDIVFAQEEWQVAHTMSYKTKPPETPITLSNMLNLIAKFGGHLDRNGDKEPGPTTIWIGLQKLYNFIQASRIYTLLSINDTYG